MANPYSLFASSAAGPITPPCSPAANVGAGRDRVLRRRLSLDSVETFTLDDDEEFSDENDEEEDEEGEGPDQLVATSSVPRTLPVVEEGEVDLRREKGMGGQAKLRVAIITGPSSSPARGEGLALTKAMISPLQRTSCQRSTA